MNSPDAVVRQLQNTTSAAEWDIVCDMVKRENGGQYPDWWFARVIQSGLGTNKATSFNIVPALKIGSISLRPAPPKLTDGARDLDLE